MPETEGASVVIPTFNRDALIDPIVDAVLADPAAREVLVVVDGATDGTFERLTRRSRTEPRLRPLWQPNAGAAKARQTGVEAAVEPIVVILDDDVLVGPRTIEGHVDRHAGVDRLVVLGHMPVPETRGRARGVATLYARAYEAQCLAYEADPGQILTSFWAGNVSMRRHDALRVGCASRALPMTFHADRDWGLRLAEAGLRGTFERSLGAQHLYRRSIPQLRRDAVAAAGDLWRLYEARPDVLGPWPADLWQRDQSRAVRALIRIARGPSGREAIAAVALFAGLLDRCGTTGPSVRLLHAMSSMIKQRTVDGLGESARSGRAVSTPVAA